MPVTAPSRAATVEPPSTTHLRCPQFQAAPAARDYPIPYDRALFDGAPDGWFLTGITGTIQDANRAAVALLHTELAALRGLPLARYVVPEEQPQFERYLLRLH